MSYFPEAGGWFEDISPSKMEAGLRFYIRSYLFQVMVFFCNFPKPFISQVLQIFRACLNDLIMKNNYILNLIF